MSVVLLYCIVFFCFLVCIFVVLVFFFQAFFDVCLLILTLSLGFSDARAVAVGSLQADSAGSTESGLPGT